MPRSPSSPGVHRRRRSWSTRNPFNRWDGTRWSIEDELVLPSGLLLAADQNLAFRTHALQVRAILACSKDARLSNKKWEVSCAVEDVGLLVTSTTHWRPQDQARVQQILDQVDARLTGAEAQLQVGSEGTILNFDLEGMVADNSDDRMAVEALRTLVSQVMAGFHLEIPYQGQRDGQWIERHTELFDIPSITAARSATEVLHQSSAWKTDRLVQTVGRGTVAMSASWTGNDPFFHSKLVGIDGSSNMISSTGGMAASKGGGLSAVKIDRVPAAGISRPRPSRRS